MLLIKRSAPGWTKEFRTKEGLVAELQKHVCDMCVEGSEWPDDGPIDKWDMDELLGTACGCEFEVAPNNDGT